MIELRIGTPNGRINVIANPTDTPAGIIEQEDIITDGANISLNGIPLAYRDLNTSFQELGVEDRATMSIVVKSDNA